MAKKCEVGCQRSCNGQVVRRMTGTKKSDPKFYCCIGCFVDLRRQGVRLREAK